MSWIRRAGRRLRTLVMRRRLERDMDDEMRLHLELEADELVRSGLAPDEAGRQARVTAEILPHRWCACRGRSRLRSG